MRTVNAYGSRAAFGIAAFAAILMVPLLAAVQAIDDFAELDTTSASAQAFWTVSDHALVTNTTTEATLSAGDTVDARAYGVSAGDIDALDARYRTSADSNMIAEFRSDRPKGLILTFR